MKAVLVLDEMPEACEDCPCAFISARCHAETNKETRKLTFKDVFDRRPEWCPLRELPESISDEEKPYYQWEDENIGYAEGWNDCIEAVLGVLGEV